MLEGVRSFNFAIIVIHINVTSLLTVQSKYLRAGQEFIESLILQLEASVQGLSKAFISSVRLKSQLHY